MFREAVVINGMTYDRFRDDFINSHTFHDEADAACKNDHQVNLGRIGSLLSLREELVRKYSVTDLNEESFLGCMREFMLKRSAGGARSLNFGCYLNPRTVGVLTCAVKELCEDREKRASMQENIRKFAVSDAGARIYEDLKTIVRR